jgi:molecular chaperone HscB
MKFHDIFGLPYEPNPFVIDVSLLKERFRDTQAICHPDSWASKGSVRSPCLVNICFTKDMFMLKDKQDIAQALSARVNEAYSCLLKPLSRAEYILARHHIPISEKDQVDDLDFMSEIMEARETIAEAQDEDDVSALVDENRGYWACCFEGFETF